MEIDPLLFAGLFDWAFEASNQTLDKKTYIKYTNKIASNKRGHLKRKNSSEKPTLKQSGNGSTRGDPRQNDGEESHQQLPQQTLQQCDQQHNYHLNPHQEQATQNCGVLQFENNSYFHYSKGKYFLLYKLLGKCRIETRKR